MANEERLRELEEKYEGYTVYDNAGSKIGKVDDLFVDERDNEEYIGVKMGFFGTKSTLIPTEIIRINESDRTIEVSESKDRVKDAPNFSDDDDVTREYEERIRSHFGLESLGSESERGGYSGSSGGTAGTAAAGGAAAGAASTTSGHDDDRDHEHSDHGSSSYDSGDRDQASTSRDTHDDARGSSEVDTEYGERRDSDAASTGTSAGAGAAGYQGSGQSTSGSEGYTEERGSSDDSGSSETASGTTGASSSGESSSGSKPSTTRQTEETETFQEGGKTKIRRRIIREEVVDADDHGTS